MKKYLVKSVIFVFLLHIPIRAYSKRNDLRIRINRLLKKTTLPGKKSVYARWLNGKRIYYWRALDPLTPASCIKVITTATVVRYMGKNYRFTTKFLGKKKNNQLTTPLYWWSNGDPTTSKNDLTKMVKVLKKAGITSIPKGVAIDSSYFTRYKPPGFKFSKGSEGYVTKPSPIAVDNNSITAYLRRKGSKVTASCKPVSPFISCYSKVKIGKHTRDIRGKPKIKNGKLKVVFYGTMSTKHSVLKERVRSLNPELYAAGVLISVLRNNGIKVPSKYKRKKAGKDLDLLAQKKSKTLDKIVQGTNKYSNNFWAENLVRALGAFKSGEPGTTAKGLRQVYGLLRRSGVKRKFVILSNGSGLFGRTKISAKHYVDTLERMHTLSWLHKLMVSSLARPGRGGTLRRRLTGTVAANYLHAKTGTLNRASCLSGYLVKGKKTIIFSIINDLIKGQIYKARKLQDEIVKTLARHLLNRKISKNPPRI
ncbi:MAG: D-alanyl-D-alanine carboxypeptidase/D-alanyl-D-alanine endopeptidase [Myxococcota bacterium]